jgi:uncharacterized protein (UPF0332 family)
MEFDKKHLNIGDLQMEFAKNHLEFAEKHLEFAENYLEFGNYQNNIEKLFYSTGRKFL